MRFGVIIFPGSNCDEDVIYVIEKVLSLPCKRIWHKDKNLKDIDCVILPGGFSYGDYLRAGAIARFSPVMEEVVKFSKDGGLVVGICNGFQILLEASLLPGAMRINKDGRFHCHFVTLRCENRNTIFTNMIPQGKLLKLPIAHREGNYYAPVEEIEKMESKGQILLRFVNEKGEDDELSNPNGSVANIAGIMNERGNVFGLMPHPERASEKILSSEDGLYIFKSLLNYSFHS